MSMNGSEIRQHKARKYHNTDATVPVSSQEDAINGASEQQSVGWTDILAYGVQKVKSGEFGGRRRLRAGIKGHKMKVEGVKWIN